MTVGNREDLAAAAVGTAAAEVAAVEAEQEVEEDGKRVSIYADEPELSLPAVPSPSSLFIKSFKGVLIPK